SNTLTATCSVSASRAIGMRTTTITTTITRTDHRRRTPSESPQRCTRRDTRASNVACADLGRVRRLLPTLARTSAGTPFAMHASEPHESMRRALRRRATLPCAHCCRSAQETSGAMPVRFDPRHLRPAASLNRTRIAPLPGADPSLVGRAGFDLLSLAALEALDP